MGKKDLTGKQLEEYADVFVDIYNHLLFEKEYLQEKGLQNDATQSVYHSENGEIRFQDRDIIKKYNDGTNYVIANFGIENQAVIDKTMPIRVMHYDASGYHKQMKEKAASVYPVITIVLNLTEKRWTAPKSVHELVTMNEKMKQYVQDYQIKVFYNILCLISKIRKHLDTSIQKAFFTSQFHSLTDSLTDSLIHQCICYPAHSDFTSLFFNFF